MDDLPAHRVEQAAAQAFAATWEFRSRALAIVMLLLLLVVLFARGGLIGLLAGRRAP